MTSISKMLIKGWKISFWLDKKDSFLFFIEFTALQNFAGFEYEQQITSK